MTLSGGLPDLAVRPDEVLLRVDVPDCGQISLRSRIIELEHPVSHDVAVLQIRRHIHGEADDGGAVAGSSAVVHGHRNAHRIRQVATVREQAGGARRRPGSAEHGRPQVVVVQAAGDIAIWREALRDGAWMLA